MLRRTVWMLILAGAVALAAGPVLATEPAGAEQAIAIGYMLDSPRPLPVITKGLALAEGLRRRYGIDTGHPVADREAAARRAQSELLDPSSFTTEEIDGMARSLGFSLVPTACGSTCDNVRRLATLELQKRLIERFVLDGTTPPPRATAPPAASVTPQ